MAVVLSLLQWWGSGVVVLKGFCVWGYRTLARSLVLRTCLIGRFFIVSVACASHFALYVVRLSF